jgi:hypothetical protein
MADDLVDQLLAQTGLYIGQYRDTRPDASPSTTRILVTALPGRSGVAFDYESLNVNLNGRFGHREHALLARTPSGAVLYTANIHAPMLMELREREPGAFEPAEGAAPFPMAIRIEVPSAGRLLYTWSFGEPGTSEFNVHITGDVTRVD